jgi:hypothetical protein
MTSPRVKGSIANGTSELRDATDFYETPRSFTVELLKRVQFHSLVWEPGAGAGAIGDVLTANGYDVLETDILPRHERVQEEDFLTATRTGRDIITNPPFKLMVPFAQKAWELCEQKFAFVMPISGLNSSGRYQAIWSRMKVSRIILSGRYQHVMSARGEIPSQFTHIWVVFDKGHEGPTEFEWLPDVVYKHSDNWRAR